MPDPTVRFVVLRHEGIDSPHFDLMIESAHGSPLMTWRCDIWPVSAPTPLTRLPDHRAAYLLSLIHIYDEQCCPLKRAHKNGIVKFGPAGAIA